MIPGLGVNWDHTESSLRPGHAGILHFEPYDPRTRCHWDHTKVLSTTTGPTGVLGFAPYDSPRHMGGPGLSPHGRQAMTLPGAKLTVSQM